MRRDRDRGLASEFVFGGDETTACKRDLICSAGSCRGAICERASVARRKGHCKQRRGTVLSIKDLQDEPWFALWRERRDVLRVCRDCAGEAEFVVRRCMRCLRVSQGEAVRAVSKRTILGVPRLFLGCADTFGTCAEDAILSVLIR